MGAWYVPEIFVLSEKRILSRRRNFPLLSHQCTKLCAQTVSCSCLAQNLVDAFFAMCRLLFNAVKRSPKQPARLSLLNLRFRRPLVGKFGLGNSVCG